MTKRTRPHDRSRKVVARSGLDIRVLSQSSNAGVFEHIELAQHLAPDSVGDLSQQIQQTIREQLNFRAQPELVPYGTLPRTEQKAQRVIKTYKKESV